jgi:hypothetical protein
MTRSTFLRLCTRAPLTVSTELDLGFWMGTDSVYGVSVRPECALASGVDELAQLPLEFNNFVTEFGS